jgi:hypothetical protein
MPHSAFGIAWSQNKILFAFSEAIKKKKKSASAIFPASWQKQNFMLGFIHR